MTGSSHPQDRPPSLRARSAAGIFALAPQICRDMTATPLNGQETVEAMIERLLAGPVPEEALTLAGYAMAPRLAVWWAHECLRSLPALLTPEDVMLLELAEAWVARGDATSRYAAMEAAQGQRHPGPGAWTALAAAWSEGSIAPNGAGHVPAEPFMCGRAVNGAVLSLLARVPAVERRGRISAFVHMARVLISSSG